MNEFKVILTEVYPEDDTEEQLYGCLQVYDHKSSTEFIGYMVDVDTAVGNGYTLKIGWDLPCVRDIKNMLIAAYRAGVRGAEMIVTEDTLFKNSDEKNSTTLTVAPSI